MQISTNMMNGGVKVRRQKFGVGTLIIMMIVGAGFLGAGIAIQKSQTIDSSWKKINGKVTSVKPVNSGSSGTTYAPVIGYTVNGNSYTITSNNSSSFQPIIGSSKQIAYNPQNPAQSKAIDGGGTKLLLLLFPVIGILMLVLAPIFFIKSLKRGKTIKDLVNSGTKLQGVLIDVQTTPSGNNNSTYKMVVAAPDSTGGVQNYTSDSLMGIGGLAMMDFRQTPIPIDVYIDPANPARYYVDVSDVPNLTSERIGELLKNAIASRQPESIVPMQNIAAPQFAAPIQPAMPVSPIMPMQPPAPIQSQVQHGMPDQPTATPRYAELTPQPVPPQYVAPTPATPEPFPQSPTDPTQPPAQF